MPLCHWPCSCYPNHALRQTGDWMNEIYEMWVRAHGVILVTPVYWYQVASAAQADDRSPGLRRRRQSRSDQHPRQEAGRSQGAGTQGLGLSQAPGRPHLRRGGARRRRRHRGRAARAVRLARLDGADRRRQPVRAWTATSAITSPTRSATTRSTRDPACRKKCATSRARWPRQCANCAPAGCSAPDRGLHDPRPK